MFSTVSMAVYMEWSWLLLVHPVAAHGVDVGRVVTNQLRMVPTVAL